MKISEELKGEILVWQKNHRHLPVRWLRPEDWHITIIPPWEGEWREADEKLKTAENKTDAFEIALNQISCGPSAFVKYLIWATGEKAPPELLDLKNLLEKTLAAPPRQSFKLHITLAKFIPGRAVDDFTENINWSDKITSFVLMQSHQKPEGAEYDELGGGVG